MIYAMATATGDTGTMLRGRFWLQGVPDDQAVSGRLSLQAGSHPLLELDGSLVPLMWETSRGKPPDGREARISSPVSLQELTGQSLTVHGTLDETGELVTLPSVFTAGGTISGNGSSTQRLRAFYALLGDHVDGTDALFTRVRVRMRHLDAWADLPGFNIGPGAAGRGLTLTYEPPTVAPAALASGAQISLDQVATCTMPPSACGGRLERSLWLDIRDIPSATYDDLGRRIIKPLMNLLSFATGMECPLVEMTVSAGPDHPWLTVRNDSLAASAVDIIPLQQILLPRAEIGLEGVAAWVDSTASLGPLPAVVARIANSQDDPLEAQLLELTSAAEGLHRLLRPGQRRITKGQASKARARVTEAVKDLDEDVRDAVEAALHHLTDPSYPRRLLDLAEQARDAVPGVTGDAQEWKKRVSNARNSLAHKLERGFLEDQTDAQESVIVLLSLRWLLTGILLLRTGISPVALGSRFVGHQPYKFFMDQARAWLPAVYADSYNRV